MKVLHIAETVKGGVSTVINSLIIRNNEYNIQSFVLAPQEHAEFIKDNNVITYKRTGRNIYSFICLAIATVKNFKKIQPEVIHLHSSFAGFIVRILFATKILSTRGVKIIYTPHAFPFLMGCSAQKKKLYAKIEIFLSRYTNSIVCTSDYEYNVASQYGINKDKLTRIYNGIDFSNAAKKDTEVVDSFQENKINILFVGRFDFQKGYDYLLEIIQKLDQRKYYFHIIGDSVLNNVTNKICQGNVKYYGWIANDNLSFYFKSADFLIMPSRWESFGIVAIEAQANALPVLANKNSSLPEVIENGVTGILEDFDRLDKVLYIIENTSIETWQAYSKNCMSFVSEKFNVRFTMSRYFELYLDKAER